ncbi:hypothetical protein [Enterococcus mundtii]|nr:hypothetical protein [Enterococcus mundtii]
MGYGKEKFKKIATTRVTYIALRGFAATVASNSSNHELLSK